MNVKAKDGGCRMWIDADCDDKRRTDCPICTVTAVFPGEDNGLRLVKVEVSLAELTGPVQYIQQLELNSESTTKVTAVPN